LADGATAMAIVPSMLRALLREAHIPVAPRLTTLLSGGEVLTGRLGLQARTALPRAGIYDLYGLTETGACDFCLSPAEFDARAGSTPALVPPAARRSGPTTASSMPTARRRCPAPPANCASRRRSACWAISTTPA